MNLNPLVRILRHPAFWAVLLASPSMSDAQSASTVPMGALKFAIGGGSVAAPVTTTLAIPLQDIPAASGATVGRINARTATTITATGAGWTAGALAMPAAPYAFQITSGAAAGATFVIIANTADMLTTSGVDLTAMGVIAGSAGDTFRLVPIDTLNTLFGATTFLGGANSAAADIITLGSSLPTAYYYNTTLGRWVRTIGPTTDRGNVPLPPNGMISVARKSGAMTLTLTGRVPDARFYQFVLKAGSTYTHTGFPTDVTLGALSMQTALAGWVSAPTANAADTVSVSDGATWLAYFYNGSHWQRTTGPATNSDSITIPAGTPVLIFKNGTAAGTSAFVRNPPYSL